MEPAHAHNMQQCIQQWQQQVRLASADGRLLRFQGGGSKNFYGQNLQGELLDTRALHGIVAYEPSELVMTAYCGTPLAEIEQVLLQHEQMLAFEPPHFSANATLGGMFAAGISGPRRVFAGALRDYVLGASVINGAGELLHFGGQVMKNVAGYDVSRLLAGSLGCLGLVTQVSLKVMPLPKMECSLRFEMGAADALSNLHRWRVQGVPVSASACSDGQLTLRLSGSEAAVLAARNSLGGASLAHADAFWHSVREQSHAFFDLPEQGSLWRISVPDTAPLLVWPAEQWIEWDGAQRWLRFTHALDAKEAAQLRKMAATIGGHATLFRAAAKDVSVFTPLPATLGKIHQALKHSFDGAGIFNRGRMYQEW